MRLPHITIEYREDENYAIGRMSVWLIVGLALCIAWALITLLNGHTLIFPNIADYREVFNNSAVLVYALTFLCYGIFHKEARKLFSTPKKRNTNRLVATLCMALSAALMACANTVGSIALPAVLIGGFLAGFGSTVLTMSFAVSFSVCDVATAGMSAGLSFALAVVIYAFVTKYCLGMTVLCAALCFLCPFAEFFCLYQCSKQLVDHLKFRDLTISVKPAPFSLHIVLPCLLAGFVISTIRVSMTKTILATPSTEDCIAAVVSAAALSLALVIGSILTQRQRFNFMARTLFPVSALLLSLLAFINADNSGSIFLFTCAYVLLDCALWVCLSDVSQRFRVSAFVSFGFGYGALMLGSLASLVLMGIGGPLSFLVEDPEGLTVVSLVLLIFSFAFLPNTTEVMDSLDIKGRCPALTTDALELEILQEPFSQDTDTPKSTQPNTEAASTPPTTKESAMDSQDPVKLDELDDRDEKQALEVRTNSKKPGRFKRKCAKVAETYLLSRKETEVLFLLAKGRNAAAIQDALYIAAGTANTHMRHIYRKLDVHSQQELIKLVEATEVDEED